MHKKGNVADQWIYYMQVPVREIRTFQRIPRVPQATQRKPPHEDGTLSRLKDMALFGYPSHVRVSVPPEGV